MVRRENGLAMGGQDVAEVDADVQARAGKHMEEVALMLEVRALQPPRSAGRIPG